MGEVEIWKSLEFLGYPEYEVSNFGNVKSLPRNTTKGGIMKQFKNCCGYLYVSLCNNNKHKKFTIHRLVALTFLENDNPTEKTQVNHLDENKENNHVDNLCWCSCIENNNFGTRNERAGKTISQAKKGKPQYKLRKPILQHTLNGEFVREWDSATTASEELNICRQHITACCKGKRNKCGGYIWRYKETSI